MENIILELLQKQENRLNEIVSLLSLSKTVLNINEVSKLTGLSKSTIYKFTHSGTIPHFKKAKHLYFNKAEIEGWLMQHRGFNAEEMNKTASISVQLNDHSK